MVSGFAPRSRASAPPCGTVSVQPSPTVTRSLVEPGTGFQARSARPSAAETGLSGVPRTAAVSLSVALGSRVSGLVATVCGGLTDDPGPLSAEDDEDPLPHEVST